MRIRYATANSPVSQLTAEDHTMRRMNKISVGMPMVVYWYARCIMAIGFAGANIEANPNNTMNPMYDAVFSSAFPFM